jgi:hypothetical protein
MLDDDAGGEKLNPQLLVQKESAGLGRRDQVLQVVTARRLIIKFDFEFRINRLQLPISRLKLSPPGKLLKVRAVFLDCSTGAMKSTTRVAISFCGIAGYSASSGSCTKMTLPASFMARMPSAPSEPAPLSTTANPPPRAAATERKNLSIGARLARGSVMGRAASLSPSTTSSRSGGNDVSTIRTQLDGMLDLFDGHACPSGENCVQVAWVVGRQVGHDHIGQSEIVIDRGKEILERSNATCRCTDWADRRMVRRRHGS